MDSFSGVLKLSELPLAYEPIQMAQKCVVCGTYCSSENYEFFGDYMVHGSCLDPGERVDLKTRAIPLGRKQVAELLKRCNATNVEDLLKFHHPGPCGHCGLLTYINKCSGVCPHCWKQALD